MKLSIVIAVYNEEENIRPMIGQITAALRGYDYEIIYGMRRWFACSQIPKQKYLVKVTDADDKACSILMHIENADSKDISELSFATLLLKNA